MLPTDFAIFSSSICTMPLCIQVRDRGLPRAASVCAISFSWCGKTRSDPPPCTSNGMPSTVSAIAEHSMCQPGRPSPRATFQIRVLPLLARLPEREVLGRLLQLGDVVALTLLHLLERPVRQLPVVRKRGNAEVDVATALVGVIRLHERLDQGDDLADRLRGLGLVVGLAEGEPVGVLPRRKRSSRARAPRSARRARGRRRRSCRSRR